MDVERQQVVEAFPELADVPAGPQWAFALARARSVVADRFGDDSDYAVMLYAAHTIAGGRQAATGRGEITSETVGSVSRTYATGGGATAIGVGLGGTIYGAMFIVLAGQYVGPWLLST